MNFMNVLSDFIDRVNSKFPEDVDNEELNSLTLTINAQEELINKLTKENKKLKEELKISSSVEAKVSAPTTKRKTKTASIKKTV